MTASDRTPYPGLRAFRRDETHLFFGRDGCVEAMIERLKATRFLAVLGSSGTGKSSLVQTGLISGLEMGLLGLAKSRWRIVDFRPRGAPLRNLARRLLATEKLDAQESPAEPDEIEVEFLRARLKREPWSLFKWCQEGHLPKSTNLLLLVDQFEELFRYQTYEGREEAEAFVARLLETNRPPEFVDTDTAESVYVTTTMRSEFLGACSLIENLAEAINEGAYLTPRMTRSECREAIEGPAEISGIEIEEALVNRLLNDLASFASWSDTGRASEVGGAGEDQLSRLARRADQLPLMQHALNRMWEEVKGGAGLLDRSRNGEQQKSPPIKLTLENYESIGGLQGALDKHADTILAGLKQTLDEQLAFATTKMIFRAVTTGTTVADAVRRPTRFSELVKICGDDRIAVHEVVNAFRAEGCNFLQPEIDAAKPALDDSEFVDITHESLIRQWTQLREWAGEEFEAAGSYRRLEDTAKRWKKDEAPLWTKRELDAWREREPVNEAWAARYGDAFGLAMEFLGKSQEDLDKRQEAERLEAERKVEEEKREAIGVEREAAKRDREKAAKRLRMVVASAIGVAVIAGIVYLVVAMWQQAAFATRNFQLAVNSAQKLLDQVGESLNHGDIGVKGAKDMLKVASGIVEQVHNVQSTPETIALLVKLAWTASDIHATLGNLTQAYDSAKSARDLVEPFYVADPNDPKVLALLYNSIWRMGDAIADRDLARATQEQALKEYLEAEKLARRLAEMAPEDGRRQRNVVFVLQKIGDVRQALGDWPSAIAVHSAALKIMQNVVAKSPENQDWQRDLANTLSRLGQALAGKGDLDAALEQYRAAFKIRSELAAADRMDDVLQSNLATSHREIARLYAQRDDLDAALAEYQLAIGIREPLYTKDPTNANWQTSLAPLYAEVGAVLRRKSDLAGALEQYRKAYSIRRELAIKDPTSPGRQHRFATAGMSVADLLVAQNKDLDEPVKLYRAAIDTLDDLRPRYDRDVFRCYIKIGDILKSRDDGKAALKEYKVASAIAQEAAAKDATSVTWQKNLAESYATIGKFLIEQGHTREALEHYEKALEFAQSLAAKHPENVGWAALVQLLKTEIERLALKP